jgi:purine-binding chemotaxis protein CheW
MAHDTARHQLVILNVAAEPYALRIGHVHEIIRYTPPRSTASTDPWVQGVINLRVLVIPVYDIASRLGRSTLIDEHTKIVIVETESKTAGLIVDAVDEVQTIDGDQLKRTTCADHTLIDSIAKIDNRLVVLLNSFSILGGIAQAE